MRISDWSSDVCSSDLLARHFDVQRQHVGLQLRDHVPCFISIRGCTHYGDAAGTLKHVGKERAHGDGIIDDQDRSEEHTSELQSLMRISYAVFCLKKKTIQTNKQTAKITTNAYKTTYIIMPWQTK